MKNYCALVFDGCVTEIIVADFAWVQTNLTGDWHDLGPEPLVIAIGWIFDSATNSFAPPPMPQPLPE